MIFLLYCNADGFTVFYGIKFVIIIIVIIFFPQIFIFSFFSNISLTTFRYIPTCIFTPSKMF